MNPADPSVSKRDCPICGKPECPEIFLPLAAARTAQFAAYNRTLSPEAALPVEPFRFCEGCGVVFRAPGHDIPMESLFKPVRTDAGSVRDAFPAHQRDRLGEGFQERYRWLARHSAAGRLLDVGCAYGFLVKAFAQRGYQARGIDPNAEAVAIGRETLGVDLDTGFYGADSYPPASFDVISAECVAYYFRPSFATFVDAARRHLRPGGILYLQIPGTERIGVCFMPNYVRTLVPFENAEAVFARMGFAVVDKRRDLYNLGSYGLILRWTPEGLTLPDPVLGFAPVQRQLVQSDYNLLIDAPVAVPGWAAAGLAALHRITPGGTGPRYFAALINRIKARVVH